MKLASIQLPFSDNPKDYFKVDVDLVEKIVKKYANCTATAGVFYYRNPETEQIEDRQVTNFSFLCPNDSKADQFISELAKEYGKRCGLKYVQILVPNGNAEFVDIEGSHLPSSIG